MFNAGLLLKGIIPFFDPDKSRNGPQRNDGGEIRERLHSEETAREIDQEIKSIIDGLFQQTKTLLVERREILERLTERLLEKEIIENEELKEVIESVTVSETQP